LTAGGLAPQLHCGWHAMWGCFILTALPVLCIAPLCSCPRADGATWAAVTTARARMRTSRASTLTPALQASPDGRHPGLKLQAVPLTVDIVSHSARKSYVCANMVSCQAKGISVYTRMACSRSYICSHHCHRQICPMATTRRHLAPDAQRRRFHGARGGPQPAAVGLLCALRRGHLLPWQVW
jgi:hypothetical protein